MSVIMTAYWSTAMVIGFVLFFANMAVLIHLTGRTLSYALRIVIPLDILLVLYILVGIWLPVLIGGN